MISPTARSAHRRRRIDAGKLVRWMGVVLLLAGAIWAGFLLDEQGLRWIGPRRANPTKALAQFITHMGDWPTLVGATVVAMLIARAFRARRTMALICVMFAATLLAGVVVQPLRGLTGRTRPTSGIAEGWYGVRKDGKWIIAKHEYCAFPSAHTTVVTAFVTPLIVIGGARWLPIWLVAVAVGWSRIYLGAHHPSDVMAGLVLGSGCGWLVARWPALRLWTWRFSSALCGFGRLWPGWPCGAALHVDTR